MKTNYWILFLFITCTAFFAACGDEGTEDGGGNNPPVLELSKKLLEMPGTEADSVITVQSNVEWKATWSEDWIDVRPNEGNGDATITVSTLSANEGEGRSAKITFTYGDNKTEVLNVTQGIFDRLSLVEFGEPYLEGAVWGGVMNEWKVLIPYRNGMSAVVKNIGVRSTDSGFDIKYMDVTLEADEGVIEIPVTGMPKAGNGAITFTINCDSEYLRGKTIESTIKTKFEAFWNFSDLNEDWPSYGITKQLEESGWPAKGFSTNLVQIGNLCDQNISAPMLQDRYGYFGGINWNNDNVLNPVAFFWFVVTVPEGIDRFGLDSLDFVFRLNKDGAQRLSVQYYIDKEGEDWVQRLNPEDGDPHSINFNQYAFTEAVDMEIPWPEFGGYGDQSCKNTPPIHIDLTEVEGMQNVRGGEQLVVRLVPYQADYPNTGVVAFTSKDLPDRFADKNVVISGVIE